MFSQHPKAKYWSAKNTTSIDEVTQGSGKKFWFDCDCGHSFKSAPRAIQLKKGVWWGWCGYCKKTARKLCSDEDCDQCFNKSFASHPKSKYWDHDKNDADPRDVIKSTGTKYWFNCPCGHDINVRLSDVSRGRWCKYCASDSPVLCGDFWCEICFDKSFACHPRVVNWMVGKNCGIARDYALNSHQKKHFKCYECLHEFKAPLYSIAAGYWCAYCANKKLCNDACEICFEKSFASHPKSEFWDYKKNKGSPRDYFWGNRDRVWFTCDKCQHKFKSHLYSIAAGSWCPYCASKKMCAVECGICFEKSFASHPKSEFWDYKKNKGSPRDYFRGNSDKFWFKCVKKHTFKSVIYNVTSGNWCPNCFNKTERLVHNALKIKYPTITQQFKPEWCRYSDTKALLSFDFVLPEKKIIIELDGDQHFIQVSNWKPFKKTQTRDIYKMKKANTNGYSIIRLLQCDVYNNTINWVENIMSLIHELENCEGSENRYLCSGDNYLPYIDKNCVKSKIVIPMAFPKIKVYDILRTSKKINSSR